MIEGLTSIAFAVLGLVVIVSLIVLTLMKWNEEGRMAVRIPGPPAWPLVGNMLSFDSQRPHLSLQHWGEQYGGICQVRIRGNDLIVPVTYDIVHEMLVTKAFAFGGRSNSFSLKYIFEYDGVFAMDTTAPHWQPLKKFLFTYPSLFDGSGQNKTNELLKDVLEDMMADMKAHGGQAADMREVTENWSFRTFYASLTGKVLPADDEQIVKFKAMVLGFCSFIGEGESAKMDMFPWIRFFGGSTFAKMERIVQLKQQLWDNMWREALQQPLDVESPTCLVQAMRGLVDTKSPNFDPIFTEAMLKTLFFDFTMGGSPHVAKLSYALLNILLHHPDVLQRLQAEVDAVTNKSSRRPTLGDVDKMPYSTAVVNELLRYVSIVPMPVRRTLEETSLAGYTIPAGHIVVFNCFAINHEESFWGDPWNFRPERFLDDQGLHLPATHANMQHMLAFGDGLRRCPARSYPWKQLFLFTTYVAQTFDVLPDDKSGLVPYDCRNYTFELVLQPPSFFAKLVPRNV